MRGLFTPLRRGSEADAFGSPAGNPYPQVSHPDLDNLYPTKPQLYKDKDTVMLENPGDDIMDGLDVKDMIVSAYDQKVNTSIWKICLAAAVGVGLGTLLSHVKVGSDVAKWIALPGDLFINALKCLIVPMVFCSVVVVIGELVEAGKAVSIGSRTVIYFLMASLTSSSVGVFVGYLFSGLFETQVREKPLAPVARLTMRCSDGGFLTTLSTGGLKCVAHNATDGSTLFYLNDTMSYFAVQSSEYAKLSVSDQIFSILKDLVPDNIINAFASASTLSVIIFALCFGIALVKSVDRVREGDNYPLLLIHHTNIICRMLINQVVSVIPFAIVSMIAGSMAQYLSSVGVLESVGWLIVALAVALLIVVFPIMGTALFLTTRRNIFSYLKNIFPAQVFIFGCSSSIATLPITLRCVDSSREVSPALARFVLPLGATSNLNGSAIYMVLSCIFMAKVGGYSEDLTPVRYVLLAFVGAVASFGVAPVPHSGLVMVITVWRTVFNSDVPHVFSLLVGTDWILNRMRAIVNITNDTIICRIIAEQCDETTVMELHQRDDLPPAEPL
ncbi:hypothetical protein Poli38472_013009 [Pythium oligandrum]|uniref:Amino acid transporter n=1 Tax=Pythium oligandrum TaxID=41045 RepID=A0A8K1CJ39_PYTOL|nr:hypothetical protein Poli38472_013009 [Pythium oligandrum]|eukprot:TMW64387.1 hypothetical protein Poli38472_013009 [Pythium oligandrum]